jgi:type II secretory pathway pseudopilin PulG
MTDIAPAKSKRKIVIKKWQVILLTVMLIIGLLIGAGAAVGFYTYSVAMTMQTQAQEAKVMAQNAYTQFKQQNLPGTDAELNNLDNKVKEIRTTYEKLAFYKYIPIANYYYADGEHSFNAAQAGLSAGKKSLAAITPYADVLGFTGEGTFTGGTAEDRLKIVLETLSKITPVLDDITNDMKTVETELNQIDAKRYPENVKGMAVRSQIEQVKGVSKGAVESLTQYRPIIEQLPSIAGGNGKRKKYVILFTNDGELRPTGGFLTAYSTIYIENGKVYPEKSDDIYELDKKVSKKQAIPEQLGRYLTTEKYWNMRDMNTNPDFKTSMDQFYSVYKTIKSEPQDIDGFIAIDTHVLVDLLKILGPVEVEGYGTFTAEKDAKDMPQVVHALSEIITRPTPYMRTDRKGILGPMMRSILTKAYGSAKQSWPGLVEMSFKNLEQRHIQMYFFDTNAQAAVEAINGGGRMIAPTNGEDFLAVVNANLGGAKSNFFITSDIKQEISAPSNGMIEKKVTITYKNNRPGDNCNLEAGLLCLNATNRDWTRIYVPNGSQLVDAQGFREAAKVGEENGLTIFEGFFLLEPNSQAKLVLTYKVPYTDTKTYRLKLWKQGGIDPVPQILDVNGGEEQITLDKDQTVEVQF